MSDFPNDDMSGLGEGESLTPFYGMDGQSLEDEGRAKVCRNCDAAIEPTMRFCPNCGQKNTDGRIKMRHMLTAIMGRVVHIDNKFLKMMWQLFIPAKVTKAYFKGKHKSYPHPLQFFFILMFFTALTMNHHHSQPDNSNDSIFNINIEEGEEESTWNFDNSFSKSLEYLAIQNKIRRRAVAYEAAVDTIQGRQIMDSLSMAVLSEDNPLMATMLESDTTSNGFFTDSVSMDINGRNTAFFVEDLALMSMSEIITTYGLTTWQEQLFIKQTLHTIRNPDSLKKAYISSMAWTLLALNAFLAFIFMLSYRKKGMYYVEHFLFMIHIQCAVLLAAVIGYWFNYFTGLSLTIPIGLGLFPYLYFSIKRFYGGKRWPTLFRSLAFGLMYIACAIFFFLAGLVVVFAIF